MGGYYFILNSQLSQDQLVEQEARFSRHLDDLTVDFRTQIDGAEAECAQYRRACEVANEQAENLRAISMDLEARLSTSEQTCVRDSKGRDKFSLHLSYSAFLRCCSRIWLK